MISPQFHKDQFNPATEKTSQLFTLYITYSNTIQTAVYKFPTNELSVHPVIFGVLLLSLTVCISASELRANLFQ